MREKETYTFFGLSNYRMEISFTCGRQGTKGSSRSGWKMRNSALDELGLRCLLDIQIRIQGGVGYIIWAVRDRTKLKK